MLVVAKNTKNTSSQVTWKKNAQVSFSVILSACPKEDNFALQRPALAQHRNS